MRFLAIQLIFTSFRHPERTREGSSRKSDGKVLRGYALDDKGDCCCGRNAVEVTG